MIRRPLFYSFFITWLTFFCSILCPNVFAHTIDSKPVDNIAKNKSSEALYNKNAEALFEDLFQAELDLSPEWQTYLGIKKNNHLWEDRSERFSRKEHRIYQKLLEKLLTLDSSKLNDANQLSYRLYKKKLEEKIHFYQWRHHNYPANQMFGVHSKLPAFLINIHQVTSKKDAKTYIKRLKGIPEVLDDLISGLNIRKQKGIIAPTFVFEHVIRDSRNVISGYPFEAGDDSALMADFRQKVTALELSPKEQAKLIASAKKALVKSVAPAYKKFIQYFQILEDESSSTVGAWSLPDGERYYADKLKRTTTTTLSSDEIHTLGLSEVKRIHLEMEGILKQVEFKGSLQDFFVFMRNDPQFYYSDNAMGRERYLTEATALIDEMKQAIPTFFLSSPQAQLKVKAVEAFREKSAGKAFYQRPAPDGSRPGIYYANLYKMQDMPTYQMAALAYHEGIPGHHMQLSIAQEIENLPTFRKHARYTAYTEGWGLYAEFIPKEFGFYQDPYSDFGRLAMELWRACRLVVDTGIHTKKWTREQAIEYLIQNTPNAENDAKKAIERYIVMPSQATAYKIGMIKILELRAYAENQLGEKYDIREFHDVILRNGPVPLDVLTEQVQDWIHQKITFSSNL